MATLDISPTKVGHVIIKAREYDAKVPSWHDQDGTQSPADDDDLDVLEASRSDGTRSEVASFIAGLNEDEQIALVALTWVGRGTYSADEFDEALETAREERVNKTEDYLLGIPLLADYLEQGLEDLGYSVEDAEDDIL